MINNNYKSSKKELRNAYDGSSDTIKTIIKNSVEIREKDAFQACDTIWENFEFKASTDKVRRVPPRGAKGFFCTLYIDGGNHALLGGDGVQLLIEGTAGNRNMRQLKVESDVMNVRHSRDVIVWYVGASAGDVSKEGSYRQKFVPMPCPSKIDFQLILKGSLTEGQHVLCHVDVEWLI